MSILDIIIKLAIAAPICFWLYKDSRARDYTWVLWTFLPILMIISTPVIISVVLLVLVVGLYLIMRPKGELIKCPKCGKQIHELLTICPFCRRDAKKECLNCHEPVRWEADQCPFCKSRNLTKS